jgi:hypothetical protein
MGTMIQEKGVNILQAQEGGKGNAWADEREMRKLASEALKNMNNFSVREADPAGPCKLGART